MVSILGQHTPHKWSEAEITVNQNNNFLVKAEDEKAMVKLKARCVLEIPASHCTAANWG